MNATTRAKMLIDLSLNSLGYVDAERVKAVYNYVLENVEVSEQADVLKAYVKALNPLLLKQRAVIESSGELSEATYTMLVEKIKSRMGASVEVESKINKKLVGGLRITCGDDIFERSASDKFNTLAQSCKIR
jgi:F0F1-type ATP synthase delta subunit